MAFKIAFYKGKGTIFNAFIRFWDGGKYSHCELVFSDDISASATVRDGYCVRSKHIIYDPNNWDFVTLPNTSEQQAREFLAQTEGHPYDLLGQLRFAIAPLLGLKKGYWCSEWCAAALGAKEPWRYSPNILYEALQFHNRLRFSQ